MSGAGRRVLVLGALAVALATVGWSAGATAVYTLAARWGLAAQARHTKARVALSTPEGGSSDVDAGRWRAVGLLRFGF